MAYSFYLKLLLLFFLFSGRAYAQSYFSIDPKVGAEIVVSSLQNMLSSPPLPRIDGGKNWEFPLSANVLTTDIDIADPNNPGSSQTGATSGKSYSIGAITRDFDGWRYFGWYMSNSVSGTMTLTASGLGGTAEIPNLEAKSKGQVLGASYRIFGQQKAPLALGVFAGLARFEVSSSYRVDTIPAGAGPSLYYSYSPTVLGYLIGTQFNIRYGPFLVNPYYLSFKDISEHCGSAGSPICVSGTFSAAGLNLGYGGFGLNAYSAVLNSQDFSDIKNTSYGLSYTIGFDL